jgi:hypothetical protein
MLGFVSPSFGQQRPLRTVDLELVPFGSVRAGFGLEFLQKQRYSLSGLEGDLSRLGVAALHVGAGERAEFEISGVIQDYLSVSRRSQAAIPASFEGNSTSDVGDVTLAAKYKFTTEGARRPALGFRFAVQLPNASNESGLGTDETNFYGSVLVSKRIRSLQLLANIGLAILGSPVTPNTQSDLVTYGLAAILPVYRRVNLVAEIHGRDGPRRLGTESQSQVRVGVQVRAAGIRWDVAALAGLKPLDADTGVAIGVTYEFQAFNRKKSPTTIK